MVALSDPDLPVHVGFAKRESIALDAVDHAAAEILGIVHVLHQFVIRVAHQEIGSRQRPVVFVLEGVDQLIDVSGSRDLREEIGVLSQKRQRPPVIEDFEVGKTTGPRDANLVRSGKRCVSGTCKAQFLIGRG